MRQDPGPALVRAMKVQEVILRARADEGPDNQRVDASGPDRSGAARRRRGRYLWG